MKTAKRKCTCYRS